MVTESQKKAIKRYISNLKPNFFGLFFYYCLPFRKKVVLANIRQVFSDILTSKEVKKLVQAFYTHVALFLFENIQMRFLSTEQIRQRVEVIGEEHLLEAGKKGFGIALLTGHFGNWELGAIGGMLNFQTFKHRFHVIRKTFHMKWLENKLFKQFSDVGICVIPKQNALDKALNAIEQEDVVVFIMDQYARLKSKDGIQVKFFGKKTGTYKSLAMIAQNTRSVVIPMQSYRIHSKHHVLKFYPPLEKINSDSWPEEVYLNTEQYNLKLEELLLFYPDQWLWFHRRWKSEA